MPSLEQSLTSNLNTEGLRPIAPQPPVSSLLQDSHRSVFLRCPVPPLGTISVDNLDQFYLRGNIPQFRLFIG